MSDQLTIDEGFRTLLIPLTGEERQLLEDSLKAEGCRDSLVAWPQVGKPSILIDGHNRLEICTRLNIPYAVTHRGFESREDVELWIIRNQLGRRNLSDYQRGVYALRIKPVVAAQAKAKMETERRELGPSGQKSAQSPVKTREVVARLAGVSHDTIRKVEQIEARAIPEVKAKAAAGEISINKAAAVASVPAEEQPAMLAKVTAPKEVKPKPAISTPGHKMVCITLDPKRAAAELMMSLSKTFLNKLLDELLELRTGGRL